MKTKKNIIKMKTNANESDELISLSNGDTNLESKNKNIFIHFILRDMSLKRKEIQKEITALISAGIIFIAKPLRRKQLMVDSEIYCLILVDQRNVVSSKGISKNKRKMEFKAYIKNEDEEKTNPKMRKEMKT